MVPVLVPGLTTMRKLAFRPVAATPIEIFVRLSASFMRRVVKAFLSPYSPVPSSLSKPVKKASTAA